MMRDAYFIYCELAIEEHECFLSQIAQVVHLCDNQCN